MKLKSLAVLSLLALSTVAVADENAVSITHTSSTSALEKIASRTWFNYGVLYLGPSLGNGYEDGATFNRFKTGQDIAGYEQDHTGSYQAYHAFSLSFDITSNVSIGYSYSFQEDFNKVKYQYANWGGGDSFEGERENGLSYNNQQAFLRIRNVAETNLFYLNLGFIYERPTTESSMENEMQFGIGIQPNINFKSTTPGLFYGMSASMQRDVYKRNSWYGSWKSNIDGKYYRNTYPEQMQTVRVSVSPYLSYMLSDKLTFRSSLDFDWDQKGDQTGGSEFNKNMVDVGDIGLSYSISKNVVVGSRLQFALEDPNMDKTALKFSMGLSI